MERRLRGHSEQLQKAFMKVFRCHVKMCTLEGLWFCCFPITLHRETPECCDTLRKTAGHSSDQIRTNMAKQQTKPTVYVETEIADSAKLKNGQNQRLFSGL